MGNGKLKQQFGRRLRVLRVLRDITQEQLAERCGVSVDHLSMLERGINGPSFDLLERLADVLGVRVKEMFDFELLEPREGA
ncbi:MAG: helix-turn-helix transcriptional regulator [Gemmatimonadaceae bacterium]|nr:helix-turn-helix transcriptional regulator [Gloeobacterales cyanobacterium ES-bin-141]